ncbi:MAG: sulfatase-like hydrolase/transferase [Phycisphaera sp.]|nr:sulfatase-like hydrolase/transferase [Phycisphaera sp.]
MQQLYKRMFLKASVAILALGSSVTHAAGPAVGRPNVLFLFSDDQQHDTIHALGNGVIKTPNIDRLVNSGVTFTNAYIMGGSCPAVCSPSRASLFTGRTLWNLENQGEYGYEMSEQYKTLPQVFREAGYTTFGTGKNEPGKNGAFNRSFSTGDKILFAGMSNHFRLRLYPYSPTGQYTKDMIEAIQGKHSSEVYADACIEFLEKQADVKKPFFAYVAFQAPHDPRQSPPEYRAMYKDQDMPVPESFMPKHPFDNGMLKIRDEKLAPFPRTKEVIQKNIADYYALITHMDAQIGRILETLEKTGQIENTIIVFTSDNGLAIGQHGLMGKQNVYDSGVHVPFIIAGPNIPQNQKRDQLCYIYDIDPTLCDLAGLKTPDTFEYKSLSDVIARPDAPFRGHLYFAFMSWQRSVRDGRYHLIEYCVSGTRHTQLFDLQDDPHETRNLAGDPDYADELAKLRALLLKDRVELNDGNTPFPLTDKQGKDFWSTFDSTPDTQCP